MQMFQTISKQIRNISDPNAADMEQLRMDIDSICDDAEIIRMAQCFVFWDV